MPVIGYESSAMDASAVISRAFDQLVKAVAWSLASNDGRETVTQKDMLHALDIASREVKEFLDTQDTATFSVASILEGIKNLSNKYKQATPA